MEARQVARGPRRTLPHTRKATTVKQRRQAPSPEYPKTQLSRFNGLDFDLQQRAGNRQSGHLHSSSGGLIGLLLGSEEFAEGRIHSRSRYPNGQIVPQISPQMLHSHRWPDSSGFIHAHENRIARVGIRRSRAGNGPLPTKSIRNEPSNSSLFEGAPEYLLEDSLRKPLNCRGKFAGRVMKANFISGVASYADSSPPLPS